MKNTVDSIIRRTQRYWYTDGLAEITVGLIFVVLSGYFLIQAWTRDVSLNPVLANLGLLAILVLVLWLFRSALQAIKARLTYPRTGYVASPRMWNGSIWQRYGLTAWLIVVCLSLFVLTFHSPTPPSWLPLMTGTAAGLTVIFLSYRFRLLRFAILACALVLVGALVAYINPGDPFAASLSSVADGVCFIISGGVTLFRYLRSTQPLTEADL